MGRKQRFKLRHYRKAPAKAIAAAPERPASGTDSQHYPQERGARFAEGGGRFTGMPHMSLRLRSLTRKLRALCWVLRRLRAGR
jgi:hypothetical protein